MKKYSLLFIISSIFGISQSFAQNQLATKQGETTVLTDSTSNAGNSAGGTITKAGKNQQSVYTPSTDTGSSAPQSGKSNSQQALPAKTQPAVIDPKKQ